MIAMSTSTTGTRNTCRSFTGSGAGFDETDGSTIKPTLVTLQQHGEQQPRSTSKSKKKKSQLHKLSGKINSPHDSLESNDSGFGDDNSITRLSKNQEPKKDQSLPQIEESVKVFETSVKESLRAENDQLKQQLFCRVCMDAPVGALLLPCRHTVMCWTCAQRLNTCPICREKTQSRIAVYMVGL